MRKQYWFSFIATALVAGCAHTGKINNYPSTQHLNQTFTSSSYAEKLQSQQDGRSQAIARLKPHSQIQLYTENLGRIEGRFLMCRDDTLFLLATQREMSIPIESIDELRVRGRATKTGAIAGGFVVGLVGFVSGLTLARVCGVPEEPDDSCPVAILSIFTLGGAATGSLFGAAIGAAVPKWHLLYP